MSAQPSPGRRPVSGRGSRSGATKQPPGGSGRSNDSKATGEAGTIRLFPGLVRIPDVAFASWDCFPDRKRPKARIPPIAPDLVVEVLSKGNTKPEMARKEGEYFGAGVRVVWLVDIRKRTVRVHTAVDQSVLIKEGQTLDGGAVPTRVRAPAEGAARDR